MIFLESADWRRYRGHLIIARRTFLGGRRYDVWSGSQLIETFKDGVAAELHVDDRLQGIAGPEPSSDPAEPATARSRRNR